MHKLGTWGVVAISGAMTIVILAGCSGSPQPLPQPTSSPKSFGVQQADYVADCLEGQGWEVTRTADGAFEVTYSVDQEAQYQAQRTQCYSDSEEKLGTQPKLTESAVSALYDQQVSTSDCLEALGFDIPDPPTKQAWVEQVLQSSGSSDTWYPYNYLEAEDQVSASQKCPEPIL
ncbi:MAG: hypothetical protein RI885_669 [Actinomycetota bacterium]